MKLAALIQGKKTAERPSPANANLANFAKDNPKHAAIFTRLAGLATLAVATKIEDEVLDALPFTDGKQTTTPPAACYCCKGIDYWRSRINGDSICRRCHPPAPGAEQPTKGEPTQ